MAALLALTNALHHDGMATRNDRSLDCVASDCRNGLFEVLAALPEQNRPGTLSAAAPGPSTPPPAIAAVEQHQMQTAEQTIAAPVVTGRQPLTVTSWHYQLQNIDVAALSRSDTDLLVIDYAQTAGEGPTVEFSRSEIEALKIKSNGDRRIVLAYLSIGEAEEYRFYWNREFSKSRPKWLARVNKDWPDNHRVRFWMDEWKAIIMRQPHSYLDRILDAGFDGVYLDRLDVHTLFASENKHAREDMLKFVKELIRRSRTTNSDFLVVAQNAEELLDDAEYRSMIDGLAKEDYVFGAKGEAKRNPDELANWSTEKLRLLQRENKVILVVEYLNDALKQSIARARIDREGFIPIFAARALNRSPLVPPTPPSARPLYSQISAQPDPVATRSPTTKR